MGEKQQETEYFVRNSHDRGQRDIALDLTVRTLEDRPQQGIAAEYITLQKCLLEPGLNDVDFNKVAYLVIY